MNQKQLSEKLNAARQLIDECIKELPKLAAKPGGARDRANTKKKGVGDAEINFGLNERNFIKTYAKGLSGPKKFVLLLAWVVRGKGNTDTNLKILETKWNKMKAKPLMGFKFNTFYSTEAKTQGWIDSKKSGTYRLTNTWRKIFD